jgi:predicted transcriptional regulator
MTRTSLAELREEMPGVVCGQRRASPLLAALSRELLDLLGVLLRRRPASITELVSIPGRAQPNVSRSLQTLAAHGLVRLVREGREVRPEAVASAVTVDLATGTYEAAPVPAMSESTA